MAKYVQAHQDFFLARDIENVYNTRALPLRFPLAELEETVSRSTLLKEIARRQHVNRVTIE
jgi:hypothetical protein